MSTAAPTLARWLAAREPAPPPALVTRMRVLLGDARLASPPTPDALVEAAAHVLSQLLADGCDTRASALDLLAADALATYAFEVAAEAPATLEADAARAMARIADVAGTVGGTGAAAARGALPGRT